MRNVKKADGVKKLFVGKDLTLVEVADIAESDLSEAVKGACKTSVSAMADSHISWCTGVDAIMHVASPYHFQINDPWKDMLQVCCHFRNTEICLWRLVACNQGHHKRPSLCPQGRREASCHHILLCCCHVSQKQHQRVTNSPLIAET